MISNPRGLSRSVLDELAEHGLASLYLFARGILGYKDLTVRTHKDFCEWFQNPTERFKLGLMPRGHFKTTIEMARIIQKLAADPERRILLVNESSLNAEYMLREIAGHILNNELLLQVYPHLRLKNPKRDVTRSSLRIPREGTYREPSVDTAGVTSRIVSRHYTDIHGDDIVSDEAMHSPTVMEKAMQFVNRLISLTVNPNEDFIEIIGTRWAYRDVYSHIMENHPYFDVFIRKAIVEGPDGPEPFFPERYSMERFQYIIENDPEQWSTQYANDPQDSLLMDFRKEWLQYFNVVPGREIRYQDPDGTVHAVNVRDLNTYIHVDPSMGESAMSDEFGITIPGLSDRKLVFLLDAYKARIDPLQQVNKILEFAAFWNPKAIIIEGTGYQKALSYFLKEEMKRRGVYYRVLDFKPSTRKSKPARIRGALQPLFSTERVYIRRGLTEFVEEYLSFGRSENEHLMDSLAQGPIGDKNGPFWRYPVSSKARERARVRRKKKKRDLGVTGYGI